MTRTPLLSPADMNQDQRRIYERMVATRGTWLNGPYAPMLHQPRLAEPAAELGRFLRYHTSLGPSVSELAILVVARHWCCDFEWYQHAQIAREVGIAGEIVDGIARGERPADLDEKQSTVFDFTRELLRSHRVADALYRLATERLGVVGVVELTGLIGYYTLIALTLNAHEVSLPAGVGPQLPPIADIGAAGR
jgi:4-carboxymuconolactone decarboxylase